MHPFRVVVFVVGMLMFLGGARVWYVSMTVESQSGDFAVASVVTLTGAALTLAALWWPRYK